MTIRQQSEESKLIKRLNQQLKEVSEVVSEGENHLLARWSRALRESGLAYSQDKGTGRYRIENTAENRENITDLQRTIEKYKPQTVREYKKEIRAELQEEAEQIAEREGLTGRERKSFVKEYTGKEQVQERIAAKGVEREIQSMLNLVYNVTLDKSLGHELSRASSGLKYSERDRAKIFNIFGKIRAEHERILRGELTEAERERYRALKQVKNEYAYGD